MVRKVTNWLQMYIGGYRIRSLMLEEWERGKGLPIYIYYNFKCWKLDKINNIILVCLNKIFCYGCKKKNNTIY